jgi:YD repeat-containing protein
VQSSLGADIEAEYDPFGELTSLNSGGWIAGYGRDTMGLEIERTLPGNLRKQITRDDLGRVTGQNIYRDYTEVDKKEYLWGANDRLLSVIDNGKRREYGYDARGNLAKTVFEDGTTEYRNPDRSGNLFETQDFSDRAYAHGGQLIRSKNREYKYDEFGNLVRRKGISGSVSGQVWRYEWNAAGMLEKVKRPDGMEVKFHYDALGRRISKQFGAVITHWVWDGNVPLHEWKTQYWRDWDTEKDCEYYREEKQPLVTWVFEEGTFVPAAKITENQRLSVVGNYMGTPEATVRRFGHAS